MNSFILRNFQQIWGITAWFAIVCSWLWRVTICQWSVNSCAIDQSVTPFLGWRRVCLLYKRVSSPSFLVSSQNLIVVTMSWFAIALDEIRTRRILREKANCKQSKICLVHRFLNEGLVACVQTHPPTSISFRGGDFCTRAKAWGF